MVLPDETKVFPAHGAGSACGKNLSTETVSTIGEQRRTNYALAPMVVEDFVDVVTQGQTIDVMTAHEDFTSVRLDCREIDEWESGHDPSARHVAMADLPEYLDELDRSRRIIVVCRSGNRSGKVTAWLTGLGYDAVNMVGGMQAWSAAGLPVVDDAGAVGAMI